jgi:hypothetical protein
MTVDLFGAELVLDPDCRDGKHQSCVGGPCECSCHHGRCLCGHLPIEHAPGCGVAGCGCRTVREGS